MSELSPRRLPATVDHAAFCGILSSREECLLLFVLPQIWGAEPQSRGNCRPAADALVPAWVLGRSCLSFCPRPGDPLLLCTMSLGLCSEPLPLPQALSLLITLQFLSERGKSPGLQVTQALYLPRSHLVPRSQSEGNWMPHGTSAVSYPQTSLP